MILLLRVLNTINGIICTWLNFQFKMRLQSNSEKKTFFIIHSTQHYKNKYV